jgi:hypothetical protein
MILIEAWIEGTLSMLQHRMADGALEKTKTRSNTADAPVDPRNEAEKGVYRLVNKQLAVPGAAFSRLMREAGGSHKIKGSRKAVKYLVPAAVLVLNDLCGIYLHDRKTKVIDFEVDSRPVVIPATKGRVMRHRARFNEWAIKFSMRIDETILSEALVRQLLTEGGEQIGIGDFRPEKGGPFGTFALVAWDVVQPAIPTKTPARVRNGGLPEQPGRPGRRERPGQERPGRRAPRARRAPRERPEPRN